MPIPRRKRDSCQWLAGNASPNTLTLALIQFGNAVDGQLGRHSKVAHERLALLHKRVAALLVDDVAVVHVPLETENDVRHWQKDVIALAHLRRRHALVLSNVVLAELRHHMIGLIVALDELSSVKELFATLYVGEIYIVFRHLFGVRSDSCG